MDFQRDWSPFQKEIDFFVLVVDQTVKISLVVGMHYPISVLGWGLSSMLAGQMRDHGLCHEEEQLVERVDVDDTWYNVQLGPCD